MARLHPCSVWRLETSVRNPRRGEEGGSGEAKQRRSRGGRLRFFPRMRLPPRAAIKPELCQLELRHQTWQRGQDEATWDMVAMNSP